MPSINDFDVVQSLSSQVDLIVENQNRLSKSIEDFQVLLARTGDIEFENIAVAELSRELGSQSDRITAIEGILDTAPREIIEMMRLRTLLEQQQQDLEDSRSQIRREIDQIYNIFLATVGALLVSVIGLIIGNLTSKRSS